MKLTLFIFLSVLLLFAIFVHTNIQISYKYEVDQAKIMIDIDSKMSKEQKAAKLKEVSELERSLNIQSWICGGVSLLSFTGLLFMAVYQIRNIRNEDFN